MQHWEILVIPLIAVGVWVLGTIFRGAEDERQKAAMRQRRPGGPAGPRPQRRPVTDLDRFLEEARRRREAAARPAPPPRPPEPRAPERRPLLQREPERPTAVTRRPEPLARPAPPPPPPEAVVAVRRAEPVVVEAVPAPHPPPPAPPPAVVEVRARTATGAAIQDQVAALLRSPRGAGAALVLTEILGPPLCRRRR
jgi:hypothetical protein